MFKNRSVVEIMVIMFTFVVGFALIATGALVAIIELRYPTEDTSGLVDVLYTSITIILGALLGLLAGKSESVEKLGLRPDKSKDDVSNV